MTVAMEPARKRTVRLPVGLLLSIGAEKPERGPGRAIDHFRPKPGQLDQYAKAATDFAQHYGPEPKELNDLFFLSNVVPDVLDIRLLAFSQTGIRGVGDTNFAEIMDEGEFEERVFGAKAFEDGFTFFPREISEVRPELRDAWEGEPVYGELTGRLDARVEKLQIKVVTSLEFCLPEIMGLGKVARISTSGRASTRNLWKGLWTEWGAFGGTLFNIPFRLELRPRGGQRFDAKEKKYVSNTIYELVLDTPHTVSQLRAAIEEHRKTFGLPSVDRLRLEGRALKNALALPAAEGEEQTREEAVAEIPDWLLNKIAALEKEIPGEARRVMLLGLFGVEVVTELTPEQAERYWKMLEAAVPAEEVEVEVVNGNGDHQDSAGEDQTASASGEPASAADALSPAEKESAEGPEGVSSDPPREDSVGGSEAAVAEKRHESPSADKTSAAAHPQPAADAIAEALPGEPMDDDLLDPVDIAGDLVIPIGRHTGKLKVVEAPETWVKWALASADAFAEHATFYAGLELWVRHRKPDVWESVRG